MPLGRISFPRCLLCFAGWCERTSSWQTRVSDLRSILSNLIGKYLDSFERHTARTLHPSSSTGPAPRALCSLLPQIQHNRDSAFPGLCFCSACASPPSLEALLTPRCHCLMAADKWLFWVCCFSASAANTEFLSVSHLNGCLLQMWSSCLALFTAICTGLVKRPSSGCADTAALKLPRCPSHCPQVRVGKAQGGP